MAYTKKPTQPPTLDAAGMVKGLSPAAQAFPEWKRWVEATSSQDVKGLRDVVNANAYALDAVKEDLDRDSAKIADLTARIAALEAQPASRPFPM